MKILKFIYVLFIFTLSTFCFSQKNTDYYTKDFKYKTIDSITTISNVNFELTHSDDVFTFTIYEFSDDSKVNELKINYLEFKGNSIILTPYKNPICIKEIIIDPDDVIIQWRYNEMKEIKIIYHN